MTETNEQKFQRLEKELESLKFTDNKVFSFEFLQNQNMVVFYFVGKSF